MSNKNEGIRFFVPIEPVGQPRQRHTRFGRNYIPKDHEIHDYKERIKKAVSIAMIGQKRMEGPVNVGLVFAFTAIKTTKKTVWHPVVPDMDNLEKAVFDSLKGICWKDDVQVVQTDCLKVRVAPGERFGVWCAVLPAAEAAGELLIWKRAWGFLP